jgi:hypothetical protein
MALKESVAKWKIVVGHHTIKSAGQHGNTVELNLQLLPILQVIIYINQIKVVNLCKQFDSFSLSKLKLISQVITFIERRFF